MIALSLPLQFKRFSQRFNLGFAVAPVILGLALGVGPNANAGRDQACDVAVYFKGKSCAELKRSPVNAALDKSLGLPAYQDGSVVFNAVAAFKDFDPKNLLGSYINNKSTDLKSIANPSPAQVRNALRTAENIRTSAIDLITLGVRDPKLWTPEQTALVGRLQTVKFIMISNDDPACDSPAAPLGTPNAQYRFAIHSVALCPSAAKLAEPALFNILSHELGHVVQPCSQTYPIYKTKPGRLTRAELANCSDDFVASNAEDAEPATELQKALADAVERDATYMVDQDRGEVFPKLVKCGIIEPALMASSSLSARRPSRLPSSRTGGLMDETESCIENLYREKSSKTPDVAAICLSKVQEHFADSFAARLVGQIALDHQWNESQVRVTAFEYATESCTERSWHLGINPDYPSMATRVQVLSNDPALASKLGCADAPASKSLCPLQLNNAGASSNHAMKKAPAKARATSK